MSADRILGPLEALIRRFTAHVDYYARYPAKVITQQSDGTLDILPEDARVPPMQAVPIRYGLPGVKATVPPGGRVLVGFEGGNPQRPMVELWDFSAVTEVHITAGTVVLNEGSLPVARKTDPVKVTIPPLTVVTAGSGVTLNPDPIELTGTITNGVLTVKA